MTSKMLDDLQSKFECLGCGKCCANGGDMLITADEVANIIEYVLMNGLRREPEMFEPVPFKPGFFKVAHNFPCQFYDLEANNCLIHGVRPAACRRYPFQSLACGETTLAGVTICEGASMTVTKEFFNDKEA